MPAAGSGAARVAARRPGRSRSLRPDDASSRCRSPCGRRCRRPSTRVDETFEHRQLRFAGVTDVGPDGSETVAGSTLASRSRRPVTERLRRRPGHPCLGVVVRHAYDPMSGGWAGPPGRPPMTAIEPGKVSRCRTTPLRARATAAGLGPPRSVRGHFRGRPLARSPAAVGPGPRGFACRSSRGAARPRPRGRPRAWFSPSPRSRSATSALSRCRAAWCGSTSSRPSWCWSWCSGAGRAPGGAPEPRPPRDVTGRRAGGAHSAHPLSLLWTISAKDTLVAGGSGQRHRRLPAVRGRRDQWSRPRHGRPVGGLGDGDTGSLWPSPSGFSPWSPRGSSRSRAAAA